MPIRISRAGRARRFNERGMALRADGRDDEALAAYRKAARLAPGWSSPWYNIGLVHKYRCEWAESLAANREALAREPGLQPATWNLAIAATALADWPAARQAWRSFGIAVADAEGPVDHFIGPTPVRVAVDHAPEVVWTDRIDPARAVIRSVPLPESGRRYGDLVLHDGAPNGYRQLRGREVPVFDELQVLQPSRHATFEVRVHGAGEEDVDALETQARAADVHVENWTANFRILCKACSEGRPFADGGHDHAPHDDADGSVRLGIAAADEADVRRILDAWARERRHAEMGPLARVLAAPPVH